MFRQTTLCESRNTGKHNCEDIAGGTQNGNDIEWKIESLKANSSGKIQYKVKVNLLEVPEISSLLLLQ